MTDDAVAAWGSEVRDYLLGRLAKDHHPMALARSERQRLVHSPIRRWWIFEGKRYSSIRGSLHSKWAEVLRLVTLLERTFNPRLKISDIPEGTVDWGQTLARGPARPNTEYVLRSSGIGLGEDERTALRGWLQWIYSEWTLYAERFKLELPAPIRQSLAALTASAVDADFSSERLRRWVHVSRRSRWPLLREVVAETLRASLEPEVIDRIPLPADRATLFELLCIVRIARRIAPPPEELRWLDLEASENKLLLAGSRCWYQQSLDRDVVLGTPDFGNRLADAAEVFALRVPRRVDISFEFDSPRRGISGILVEAKSGSQSFDEAVGQLRVYRMARPRVLGSRYLVWGITENPRSGPITPSQLDWIRREIDVGTGDVWAFCGVESIGEVLELLGCVAATRSTSGARLLTPD